MRLLLVDDHALFREGLTLVLRRLGESCVILEAESKRQAQERLEDEPELDLILLDLDLPDSAGLGFLGQLRERCPTIPIVVLSGSEGRAEIMGALDLGARGYIPKNTPGDVMLSALRLVLAGGVYLPEGALGRGAESSLEARPGMTPRRREVLTLLSTGRSNKEIGNVLEISESTVRVHVAAIFRLLGVSNRTEASVVARRDGWIDG